MAKIKNDAKKTVKQANKIIKAIDDFSDEVKKEAERIKDIAIDKAIELNNKKTPFRASSLVAKEVDNNLKQIIKDVNKDFSDFIAATEIYLASNFAIKLTKKDLEVISRKGSVIIDSLVNNTDILNQDIQNILTQNLAKGISEKRLVQELQELYPAYSRNASTLVNTGLGRLFTDINVAKFNESNLEFYLYAGPDDSITREIPCKAWVWHWFPKKDLAKVTGVRMTLWNCRHSIIPISEEDTKDYPRLNANIKL